MMMDDVGMPQAKQEELIEKLDPAKIPNLARCYKRFLFEDGYGVGFHLQRRHVHQSEDHQER